MRSTRRGPSACASASPSAVFPAPVPPASPTKTDAATREYCPGSARPTRLDSATPKNAEGSSSMIDRQVLSRAALAALLLVGFACKRGEQTAAAPGSTAPAEDPVVATLNGQKIDAATLESWIKEDLYKREVGDKAPGEVYDLRVQAIDNMVDERLLAAAATKAGTNPDQYLADRVKALGPVSDDEIKAF